MNDANLTLHEAKLREYAALLIRYGLNLTPGQTLVISSPVDCAPFARLCAAAAYERGCREVVMNWHDDAMARMKYLSAPAELFDEVPLWRRHFFNDAALSGAAYLAISASDPENFKGVEPERIVRAQRASGRALHEFDRLQMASGFPWCIASIPIPSWAKRVFPGETDESAVEKLWEKIFETVRIKGDGSSGKAWEAHLETLRRRTEVLNGLHLKSLHYENALGTDLTVALPEGCIWESGEDATPRGQRFIANIPTEEIFTAPLKTGAEGIVHAALPLVNDGAIIEDFYFEVREGRITAAHAKRGEASLRAAIDVDEGARYFGEVALVPYDSPISRQGLLYYNTLFDENARCHIAFGQAYPCIEGGRDMTEAELKEHGLNDSITHVDFMIGTRDLRVSGLTKSGERVAIMENGNFVF